MKKLLALLFCLFASPAAAGVSCTLPFQLTNGTLADATQVMANYNALTACLLNAAQTGANTDITSLAGLTTPISLNQGGTIVYTGGTSSGSANSQSITTTSPTFFYQTGAVVTFIAGFTNTGPLQVNVQGLGLKNVFRRSQLGATMSVGGEVIVGQTVQLQWDGSEFQCVSCGIYLVGEIKTFAGAPPSGWLLLDGSCQLQTSYADLYSVVGNAPGGSCSSGSFALFDGRGNVLAGLDTQGSNGNANRLSTYCTSGTLGELCGAQSQTLAQSGLPNVTLSIPSGQGAHDHTINYTISAQSGSSTLVVTYPLGSGVQVASTSTNTLPAMTTASINGGVTQTAHETVQPTLMVYTIIKY
jgi:microcystin-dependent protein